MPLDQPVSFNRFAVGERAAGREDQSGDFHERA
jgi:hypothetical protein